jgi:anaerobic ribonucleoside-triphosphate reductase activating protein
MKFGNIKMIDSSNGTGVRVSLYVSGCRNHCKGCFNEQTWDFDFGEEFTPIQENEIIEGCKKSYISGLTILGGEPMEEENQTALLPFIKKFKEECPDKTLWMFTGYIFDKDLVKGGKKFVENITNEILDAVDVLIDGPFILEQKDLTLAFRGSRNQRLLTREARDNLIK